jgi:hypothetical protein
MTYYIILEGENPTVAQYDSGILGETTKKMFYPNKGFTRFTKIVNEHPEFLEGMKILDDNNKSYTPSQFLKKIEKLTMEVR